MKKLISLFAVISLILTMLVPFTAGAADVPEADITVESDWEGTYEITENKTVKFVDVSHLNEETTYGSAVKISNGATVNLVFDGYNELIANSKVPSAGIEVENGSTVNIYGLDDSFLGVMGGQYGAAIGGIGTSGVSLSNTACGDINIYSGKIIVLAGKDAAGIGSGAHAPGGNVNIFGGDITAFGSGSGAGIGSGYASSGGGDLKVGTYDAGNITISGGQVKACAYQFDFSRFDKDILDTDVFYTDEYSGFAAGIGGGYGSASGRIVIENNAEVIAISGNGGAGIGSGRGTSDFGKYDENTYGCDVTVRGNSSVIAVALNEIRDTQTKYGGAAIGLGRGWGTENGDTGTVKIEDNAAVYAVGSYHSCAIGSSIAVGSGSPNAHISKLSIGEKTTVIARSDGYRNPVDIDNAEDFVTLNLDADFFADYPDVFLEKQLPRIFIEKNTESAPVSVVLSVSKPEPLSVSLHVPDAKAYSFYTQDVVEKRAFDVYLTDSKTTNNYEFAVTPGAEARYDIKGFTSEFIQLTRINTSVFGEEAFIVEAPIKTFEYNASVYAEEITDESVKGLLDSEYTEKPEKLLYFTAGVKDRDGNMINQPSGKVTVYVQIPESCDADELKLIELNAGADTVLADITDKVTVSDADYIAFETDSFGCYALYDPLIEKEPETPDTPVTPDTPDAPVAPVTPTAKKNNTLKAKGKTVRLKAKTLKKKKVTVKRKKAVTVKNAKGKVSYKKAKGNKKIKVAKNGKITVAKGLKKGTYKVRIKVKAAGKGLYRPATKTVTVKIVVE
ncbi:MAG: hypothetical protein K6C14_03295 [Eubacterium sp.]|nr:hypothetical protein [Eubacterium sp.]